MTMSPIHPRVHERLQTVIPIRIAALRENRQLAIDGLHRTLTVLRNLRRSGGFSFLSAFIDEYEEILHSIEAVNASSMPTQDEVRAIQERLRLLGKLLGKLAGPAPGTKVSPD